MAFQQGWSIVAKTIKKHGAFRGLSHFLFASALKTVELIERKLSCTRFRSAAISRHEFGFACIGGHLRPVLFPDASFASQPAGFLALTFATPLVFGLTHWEEVGVVSKIWDVPHHGEACSHLRPIARHPQHILVWLCLRGWQIMGMRWRVAAGLLCKIILVWSCLWGQDFLSFLQDFRVPHLSNKLSHTLGNVWPCTGSTCFPLLPRTLSGASAGAKQMTRRSATTTCKRKKEQEWAKLTMAKQSNMSHSFYEPWGIIAQSLKEGRYIHCNVWPHTPNRFCRPQAEWHKATNRSWLSTQPSNLLPFHTSRTRYPFLSARWDLENPTTKTQFFASTFNNKNHGMHHMHLHISAFCVSIFPPGTRMMHGYAWKTPHPYGFHSVRVERPPPKTCKIFMAMLCLSISSGEQMWKGLSF